MLSVRNVLPLHYRRAFAAAFPQRWDFAWRTTLPGAAKAPGPYYVDWDPGSSTFGEGWDGSPFDPNGVLLTPSGSAYHPVRIAQFGLHAHAGWSAGNLPAETFLAQARWLRDEQQPHGNAAGTYRYAFANPRYGLEPGWISAMAQGQAMSLLVRAHQAVPGEGYLAAAHAAIDPFRFAIEHGGVRAEAPGGTPFFEEYPNARPAHVLNGFVYALWGLWDLWRYAESEDAAVYFSQGLSSLQVVLPHFDCGFWSKYELAEPRFGPVRPAPLKYHALHIAQLRVLSSMANDNAFSEAAARWERYQQDAAAQRRHATQTFVSLALRTFGAG